MTLKKIVIVGTVVIMIIILFSIDFHRSLQQNIAQIIMLVMMSAGIIGLYVSSLWKITKNRRLILSKIVLLLCIIMLGIEIALMIIEQDFKSYALLSLAMLLSSVGMIVNIKSINKKSNS